MDVLRRKKSLKGFLLSTLQILCLYGVVAVVCFLDDFGLDDITGPDGPVYVMTWLFVAVCLTAAIMIPLKIQSRRSTNRLANIAEQFKLTLESIDEGIVLVNEMGRVTMINPQAEALLERLPETSIDRPVETVCSRAYSGSGYRPPVYQAITEDRRATSPTALMMRKGNETLRIVDKANPTRNDFGRVTGCVLVLRNATDEYRQRDQFQARTALLQSASELAGMAYFCCDEQGNPVNLYDTITPKFWGYEPDGSRKPPQEWVYPDDFPAFQEAWDRLVRHEIPTLSIIYRAIIDDEIHYFQMRVNQALSSTQAYAYLGILQDVTDITQSRQRYETADSLLRTIVDHLPCYIFLKDVDDDFRYTMCNVQFSSIVGLIPDQVVGKTDYDIFSEKADADHFRDDDTRVVENNENLNYTEKYVNANGEVRYGLIIKRLFTGKEGKRFLLGVGMDVTQEKLDEEARLENYALLQALMENLPGLVVIKDPTDDFKIVAWNKMAAMLTGVKAEKVIDKNEAEFLPSEMSTLFHEHDLQTMQTDAVLEVVYPFTPIGSDAAARVIQFYRKKVEVGNRTLLLILGIDITEQDRLERQQKTLVSHLRGYTRQEAVINDCIKTLLAVADTRKSLAAIIETMARESTAGAAFVYRYDADTQQLVLMVRSVVNGNDTLLPEEQTEFILPEGALEAIRERQDVISVDDSSNSDLSPLKRMLTVICPNAGSIMAAPVWSGSEFWGVTGVASPLAQHGFDTLTKRLVQNISHVVGLSMERRTEEDERQLILDALKVPLILLDKELHVARVNNSAATLFTGLIDRVNTQAAGYCLQDACMNLFSCPAKIAARDQREFEMDIEHNKRTYHMTLSPITVKGRLRNVLAFYVDTTDLVRGQKRLAKALYAAQKADRTKSHFLSTMSHELRTPLNAVIGYSELMQDTALPREEQIANLKTINFAANTLLKLINDILDLSKLESEQLQIMSEPTDLAALLGEVVKLSQPRTRQNNTVLTAHIPPELPIFRLDQMRIRQILLNIVGNAAKFTENGTIDIFLTFNPDPENPAVGSIRIDVKDTGPGVTPEYQKLIFEPFKQDDRIRGNRVYEGSGLGLTISQRLAKRMGGEITLESEVGVGSVFTLTLPRIEILRPVQSTGDTSKINVIEPIHLKGHVLLVDDVPMNLQVLGAMLTRLGVTYTKALSAAEALEAVQKSPPVLILTDIWMPEMNGDEFARILKADPSTVGIPVIAVTADTQLTSEQSSIFTSVMFKPITMKTLSDALRDLVKKQEAENQPN